MKRDVMAMSWQDFVGEFRTMYYNLEVLAAQQDGFTSFTQGVNDGNGGRQKVRATRPIMPELSTQ